VQNFLTFALNNQNKMEKILITGGAGFIGSHLCDRLIKDDCDVICLDNYFTGSKNNVRHLIGNDRFELVRHDVTTPYYAEVDKVFNLACPASPVNYQYNPIKTLKTSIYGALNMLGLAKRVRAKILHASTSEVYGDPNIHPQVESYWGNVNPIGIRSCYDEGKRAAETLCMDYYRQHGIKVKIIRIFNTYGPRMDKNDGRVVSNFIVQALTGKDITIYGNGSQTRSFQYIDDLIEGLIRMMNTGDDFTGPVNIGNPGEFSMLELANKVIELTGSKSKIIFEPLPQDDPKQRKPDISLAYEKLNGWKPQVNLETGLEKTIAYFDDLLRRETASCV
jgi:UDP-glucuronate decarboxylase